MDKIFLLLDKIIWKLGVKKKLKKLLFIEEELNCTYQKLKNLKAYQDASIIHLHNIHGGYFDLNALEKIANEKYIVWTLHDMWCLTGGEVYTFGNENYTKGIGKTPYLYLTPLNSPILDRRQYYLEKKKEIYEKIYKKIFFVPVSHWLENCFLKSYVYHSKLHLSCIHNGYDDSIFYNTNKRNHLLPRILIFNTQNPFKGNELLEKILPKLDKKFELYIVGNNLLVDHINVIHLPYQHHRQSLAELYNSVDLLIFPSLAENLPLVPLEAMACGVCVVASNIGGIPEIINHSQNGFLFNNESELIDLVNQLINNQPRLQSIGNHASLYVKEHFNMQKMLDNYTKLYESILQS